MIFSKDKKIIVFSPKKTGTKSRIILYNNICDNVLFHVPFEKFFTKYPDVKDYHKFCFVRNPWDRFISFFYMFNKNKTIETQKEMLKDWVMKFELEPMDVYYCNNNKEVAVNDLLQVEKWDESIQKINQTINCTSGTVIHYKSQYDKNMYKEWFDQEMIEKIAEKERITLNQFNYTFS